MKKYICILTSLFYTMLSFAQVDNYALSFDGKSSVNYRKIQNLNGLSAYTLQFWFYPSEWNSRATVFARGEGASLFEIRLGGEPGNILFTVGNQSVSIKSDLLTAAKWAQLTLIINQNKISSYVNGLPLEVQQLPSPLTIPNDDNSDFMLGENFNGRMDEFRIWSAALDETEYLSQDPTVKGYLLWDNTLNKYHPQYSDLLLYCKFDQNLCKNVVDYTFRHHGIMNGGVNRSIVTDNPLFKYRIVTDYFEMSRFTDVPTDKQKYLLCNDLLAIIGGMNNDGSISVSLPFDEGILDGGARYLDEFDGRKGVLSLDGTGKMSAGTNVMGGGGYSFCTWLYIDEWVEGAFIIKREKEGNKGISLRLGSEENAEIILRVNGNEYKYKRAGELVKGKWIHLGFSPTGNMIEPDRTFRFVCNKNVLKIYAYAYPETIQPVQLPLDDLSDVEGVMGENFKGKFDETVIWNTGRGANALAGMANGVNMPGFGKNVGTDYIFYPGCYWKYDKPENPGYDYFSYVEYLSIVRSAYDGYRGCKFRLCITGGGNWVNIIASPELREYCASEVAEIINGSTIFAGVDFDLEWPGYGGQNSTWTNYGKFMEVVRSKLDADKILTISPHTVSYWFPKENMKSVDYFLFQNYGPAKDHFTYESFPVAYNKFLEWGYPKEKIVMSYATTTSKSDTGAATNRVYNMGETGPDDGYNGYTFMSFNQVRWRGEQVKKQDLGGIMCWSLNCDYPDTEHPLSRLRACSYALPSNVDTLVAEVNMNPSGIKYEVNDKSGKLLVSYNHTAGQISFTIAENDTVGCVMIFNMQGHCVLKRRTREKSISVTALPADTYCIMVQASGGKSFKELFVKY